MDITDSMEISEVARYTLDCSLVYYCQGWLVVSDDLIREQDSFQSATSLVNAEVSVKELVLRRRKSVVLANHKKAMDIDLCRIRKEGEEEWIMTDNGFSEYLVRRISSVICCDTVCPQCGVCKHSFTCNYTKMPFGPKGFCKHIHAVNISMLRNASPCSGFAIDEEFENEDPVMVDVSKEDKEDYLNVA